MTLRRSLALQAAQAEAVAIMRRCFNRFSTAAADNPQVLELQGKDRPSMPVETCGSRIV
jgi:hypothetical protein